MNKNRTEDPNIASERIDVLEKGEIFVFGSNLAGQPHEADVIAAELLDAAAGIDIAQIGIYQNLQHHAGMVGRTAFDGVFAVKFFQTDLFNDTVNNPDRIVLGNKIA